LFCSFRVLAYRSLSSIDWCTRLLARDGADDTESRQGLALGFKKINIQNLFATPENRNMLKNSTFFRPRNHGRLTWKLYR